LDAGVSIAPGYATPWWLEEALTAESDAADPVPLMGDTKVDVAIVGGGYTGLWTALALREREPSLSVCVLEAEIVGFGPSGRNGGFCHGWWSSLSRLRELFGDAGALEVCRAGDRIIPGVQALGADVWLRQSGMLKVSAAPAQDAGVERAAGAAAELGLPEQAVLLSAEEVAERCRSPVFRHGVWYPNDATIQPARLVRALRAAVLDAGVALHERTPVVRIEDGGGLVTTHGRVRAEEIVLATNAALVERPELARRLTPFSSYVVLTEPVPELLAAIGWTGGEAIIDGRTFLHYFRTTPDGRVLMGSGSGGLGTTIDRRFFEDPAPARRAERGLRRLLPGLASARITHSWGGPIDVSADHIPFFVTLPGTRLHAGAGYSGNGAGPSWVGGQILASLALRRQDEWTALPLANRLPKALPPDPLRTLGGRLVRASILACEEAAERSAKAPLAARAVAELPHLFGLKVGTR
jgi:glycine/D-amino acid oxidase-like deaminating enzyme